MSASSPFCFCTELPLLLQGSVSVGHRCGVRTWATAASGRSNEMPSPLGAQHRLGPLDTETRVLTVFHKPSGLAQKLSEYQSLVFAGRLTTHPVTVMETLSEYYKQLGRTAGAQQVLHRCPLSRRAQNGRCSTSRCPAGHGRQCQLGWVCGDSWAGAMGQFITPLTLTCSQLNDRPPTLPATPEPRRPSAHRSPWSRPVVRCVRTA